MLDYHKLSVFYKKNRHFKLFIMKKYFLIFFAVILCISCDDISSSRLTGKWQLKTVEKNGIVMPIDTVWYNFQSGSVFSVQVYISQLEMILDIKGVRTQKEDVISIFLDVEYLTEYLDWDSADRSFTIEKLEKKKLTLRSEDGFIYSFIKF